jgi:putative hydrolase of the HAD superfamily
LTARPHSLLLVIDFDGVLRLWPGADFRSEWCIRWSIGAEHLDHVINETSPRFQRLLVGDLTYNDWSNYLRRQLGRAAADAWLARPQVVDTEVVSLVEEQRRAGRRVVMLTNGTTQLRNDLTDLGVADLFDAVYNSAELGVAKPDPAVFDYVSNREDFPPRRTFFIDDRPANIRAAIARNWNGKLYEGVEDLRRYLEDLPTV